MGGRKPDAWTPLDARELKELQQQLSGAPSAKLVEQYESLLQQAQLAGEAKYPPQPWVIQTLVQVWRALHGRYPKGR